MLCSWLKCALLGHFALISQHPEVFHVHSSSGAGSGKTAAFALPLLERLLFRNRRIAATYALVLTPTRELAVQVKTVDRHVMLFL